MPAQQAEQAAEKIAQNLPQLVKISATRTHIGPMPPVDIAAGYEKLYPGSVQKLFEMAELDQKAYIEGHKDKNRRDDRFRILALGAGFVALICILGVIVYLAPTSPNVAMAVAGMGAVGIITKFVNARFNIGLSSKKTELPVSKEETSEKK